MIRRPPRSTLDRSSAASDVYKRQFLHKSLGRYVQRLVGATRPMDPATDWLERSPSDLVERGVDLGASPRAIISVSYTHLRAHETVLDLVCRLLLEKKKACHLC